MLTDHAPLDVIVIGAGQAGLALGYHLARRDSRFLLLDAAPEIGHSWRSRWDSLRLFTPAQNVLRKRDDKGMGVRQAAAWALPRPIPRI
jgi:cation diffusion facilitator CzcD-associated flavoprotein CzcO